MLIVLPGCARKAHVSGQKMYMTQWGIVHKSQIEHLRKYEKVKRH